MFRLLKRAIRSWIRGIWVQKWMAVVVFRGATGRFFVYRDVPLVFTRFMAMLPDDIGEYAFPMDGDKAKTVNRLVQEARDEVRLRRRRVTP